MLEIADEKRGLLMLSGVFSSLSAIGMLVPYVSVYFILAELLNHAADLSTADRAYMIRWGWIALAGLVGGLAFMYVGGMCAHIAAFRILYGLRVKLAERIGKLPLGFLNRNSTGQVKIALEHNVEKIEKFVAHQLPDLVQVTVTIIVMFTAMFLLDPWLALVSLVPLVLGFAAQASMMVGQGAQESLKAYHDALEKMNSSAVQYVRGIPVIKIFGQTVHSFRKFYADMIRYRDFCVKFTDRFQNGYVIFKGLLSSFAAFILPVGVYMISRDPNNIAFALVLLFFLIMAPGVSAPMYKMLNLASGLRDIGEGVQRIDRILGEKPMPETSSPELPAFYDVQFDQVSFSYHAEASARKEALSNVSFLAAQGTVTALVGPSGAGKSTVASLLPRFWDVQAGAIRIGGVDIRNMRLEDLMNTVAFVFQDTFLFYDTLYENIRIGRPDATREEVIAAAKAARCHELIESLPQGYDTVIGEGGVYLSGGEEQRVTVARAILKNAPILVLDEATAFADPENEYELQLALKQLIRGKTVIVIAHRLPSIREADQIIVMCDGSIAEQGTHEQLIANNGLYKKMWDEYTGDDDRQMEKEGVSI